MRVDQTTVGRRIAALEHDLGARLFDRTPDGLALTEVGEKILGAVEDLERAALMVERVASGEDARLAGVVRIATSDAFACGYLLERLAALRHRHPGIALEVAVAQPSVDLSRREADIALRFRPRGGTPGQPDVVARRVGDMAFAAYASREYVARNGVPDTDAGFAAHDVIAYDDALPPIPGVPWLRDLASHARSVTVCSSILSLHAAARGGLGLAVLPCFLGEADQTLLRVRPGDVIAWADMWLVVHADLRATARIRAVMDWIAGMITSDAALFRGGAAHP